MELAIQRLLPRGLAFGRGEQRFLLGMFAALGLLICASAVNVVAPSLLSTSFVDNGSSTVVYGLVAALVGYRAYRSRTQRLALALIASGLGCYGLGYVIWTFWISQLPNPPIPSVCDGLWLAFYPLNFAGLVLISRGGAPRGVRALIDSIIVASTVAALGATLVLGPVLARESGRSLAVLTELAYPTGDILLAGFVMGVISLRGWRLDRMYGLLAGGFIVLALADCIYALAVSHGASQPSQLDNLLYLAGAGMLAAAVWQHPRAAPAPRPTPAVLMPTCFAAIALGLLLHDHTTKLNSMAWSLAVVALVAAIVRMVVAFHDLGGLAEARLQAGTDELTTLANRRGFIKALEEAIATAGHQQGHFSVLMLDLDNFKELNDTLGHIAGDELLALIGPRIQGVLAPQDTLARLGGDEFAVLSPTGAEDPIPGRDGPQGRGSQAGDELGERVAQRMRSVFEQPFMISGLALRVTGSIGIAGYPYDGVTVEDLLKRADIALYQAKATGTGHAHYSEDRDTHSRERLVIAHELAEAIERGELQTYFQPQVDAAGVFEGAEALVRWIRADGRMVPPNEFLGAVEQAGLSRELTRCVLGSALDELVAWRESGHALKVSVNTTVADLLDERFPEEVQAALSARRIPADRLVLEVTETSILSDPVRIGKVLCRLHELGICLSLDDFGTGFSSLEHLRSLPVKELKIDRSFVSRLLLDRTDAAIIQAIVLLARQLEIRIVAEGVENVETWSRLADLGCDLFQGYEFSRPVPSQAFRALLAVGRAGNALPVPA